MKHDLIPFITKFIITVILAVIFSLFFAPAVAY